MFLLLLLFFPFLWFIVFVLGVHLLVAVWPILLVALAGWGIYKLTR